MKIKNVGTLYLSIALALILTGCATSPQTLQTTELDESSAPSADVIHSIAAARENAIADTDQLVLLEEVLESADALNTENSILDEQDTIAEPENTTDITETETNSANQTTDIWTRIRNGFMLQDKGHSLVENDKNWYATHQHYLDRTFERASPYLYYIVEQVEARGMPMEIALLPVVESAFQPFAYSHGRASGLWQFIPGTGRRYGLDINWWYDGRRDIKASTTAALDYLEDLNQRFDGDWLLALAAYNSGEGTVSKAIRNNKRRGKGTTFWDLDLPKETRGYVPKLLAIASIVAKPQEFNVTLTKIPDQALIDEVDIGSQLDLAIAADMAGLSLEQLYIYNPAFNRWATAPNGPHRLLLPREKIDDFKEKLAELPAEKRVKWVRHRINNGETLGQIADKYRTTVNTIQEINDVNGSVIRAGKYLLIPVASKSATDYALSAEQRLHSKQNTPKGSNKIAYTVRAGDTLWDISIAHKVSHRNLASWNGMAPTDTLRPGQKLVIWTNSKATSAPTASIGSRSIATQKINYRVRNGDSLALISQKFNVSVSQLKRWNPTTTKSKYIQPGQHLLLYVDVTQVAETS